MIDPQSRRAAVLLPFVLAGLSMLGPFSTDTQLPAFPDIGADFGASAERLQLLISTYLYAFAVMSIFHGPISDALGRKRVIVTSMAVYALASLAGSVSSSLTVMVGCRVFQGLSAGGGVIVSRAIVRDLYDGPRAQRLMSRVMMIFGAAPALAPIVGGVLVRFWSWPAVFLFQSALAISLILTTLLLLPETHPRERRTPLSVGSVLGSLGQVLRNGRYLRIAWAAGLSQASWFVYVGGASILMVRLLGRRELDFWMLFLPIVAGTTIGAWLSGRAAGRISGRTLVITGYAVGVAGAVLNVGLASLFPRQVATAVVGPAVLCLGIAMLFPTAQLALLDQFPRARGAATSGSTFIGLGLSATITMLTPYFSGSVRTMALGSLAVLLTSGVLWGWQFRAGGGDWRAPRHPENYEPTGDR